MELLEHTLDALAVQSWIHYEVIVVDDGGNDGTEGMIKARKDHRLHYIKTFNRERGAARNEGVRVAKGSYITFLDSDDIPYPNLLAEAQKIIVENNQPPFLHIAYEIKDQKGHTIYSYNKLKKEDKRMLVDGNPLSCIGVFIRKDVALAFPFTEDRDLSGSEDWELWLRIVAKHGIITSNCISAAIINHPDRSVKNTDPERLYKRKELALKYAFADQQVQHVYNPFRRKIEAFADSYISLHLALSGYRLLSIKYLFRAILGFPWILFNRRPLVIVKRILLGK